MEVEKLHSRSMPGPVCLGPGDPGRAEAERFARRAYREAYGASLAEFPPHLLVFGDPAGRIRATLGFRAAADGALFLEQYLDHPIDSILALAARFPVPRREIVEISGLASVEKGAAMRVIPPTALYLYAAGFRYAVFTATARLRNSFKRLNLDLWAFGEARRELLEHDDGANWGSYYQHHPQVCGGRLDQIHDARLADPMRGVRAMFARAG